MKIKIEFSTDNAAFNDDAGLEIRYVLQSVALNITAAYTSGPIRDSNGNTIGAWSWE